MKVLLINTGMDNEYKEQVIEVNKRILLFPQLTLPYLAALTPQGIEVEVIDEMHGLITEFVKADIVGISGIAMNSKRMYWLADNYRAMGIPVILGGIHVSFMPDEAMPHADAIVIGEADELWPRILIDFQNGALKPVYRCIEYPSIEDLPFPRLDLVDGPKYQGSSGTLNVIMVTRGCPHSCKYCLVGKMHGQKMRVRSIQNVVSEMNQLSDAPIYFQDDNLIGDPVYAKELFSAMIPLNRKWFGAASIKIADNAELLNLAQDSGCKVLFLGIESTNPKNIIFVNKKEVNAVE